MTEIGFNYDTRVFQEHAGHHGFWHYARPLPGKSGCFAIGKRGEVTVSKGEGASEPAGPDRRRQSFTVKSLDAKTAFQTADTGG